MGLDDLSKENALVLANYLREQGISCEIDYVSTAMKSQFKSAERANAKYIGIIGEDERNNKTITVKNTISKTQETIQLKI